MFRLWLADDERRGRDIHSFLLLSHSHGRAVGRKEKAHGQLGSGGHAGRAEHRAFRRDFHDDR